MEESSPDPKGMIKRGKRPSPAAVPVTDLSHPASLHADYCTSHTLTLITAIHGLWKAVSGNVMVPLRRQLRVS